MKGRLVILGYAFITLGLTTSASALPSSALKVLPILKQQTQVPILLPDELPFPDLLVPYVEGVSTRKYTVTFDKTVRCRGARACSRVIFVGEKNGQIVERTTGDREEQVKLTKGKVGRFLYAGNRYSIVQWSSDGTVYSVYVNFGRKLEAVEIANSAIQAGVRNQSSKQSRQPLQNLSDGIYFYKNSASSAPRVSKHLIFRKKGSNVTGAIAGSLGTENIQCFSGTIEQNLISNVVQGGYDLFNYDPRREEPRLIFQDGKDINLSELRKQDSRYLPDFGLKQFSPERCAQVMANAPAGLIAKLPSKSPKLSLKPIVPPSQAVTRYPEQDEFNRFKPNLQARAAGSKLTPADRSQRQSFQNTWKSTNPAATKFIGAWYTGNRYVYVYPSKVNRRVCVITENSGKLDLSIGLAQNRELRYGNNGLFWVDQSEALAARDAGTSTLYPVYAIQAAPSLNTDLIEQLQNAKCTTSLPTSAIATKQPKPNGQPIGTRPRPFETLISFRDVRTFGLRQLSGGDQSFTTVPDALRESAKENYKIPTLPKLDLLSESLTEVAESPGQLGGKRKEVSYADYLTLKLKVQAQTNVYNSGIGLVKQSSKYLDKLNQDTQFGGQSVYQQITDRFDKLWKEVEERDNPQKFTWGNILRALTYSVEESRISTGKLIEGSLKTGLEASSAFVDIDALLKLLDARGLKSLLLANNLRITSDYLNEVEPKMKTLLEASKAGDTNKANDTLLEIASATVKWADTKQADTPDKATQISKVLEIRAKAMQLEELTTLRKNSSMKEVLGSFDNTYLTATGIGKVLEIVSSVLSLALPEESVAGRWVERSQAITTVLLDALKFSYQEDVRRQYEQLNVSYSKTQKTIEGLASVLDFSAEEVGKYLLKSKPNVVRRKPDGSVDVSIKDIVYPP